MQNISEAAAAFLASRRVAVTGVSRTPKTHGSNDRLARELAAFTDIAHRYVSYVEQGDAFADEWVFVGTHTGPLQLPDGTELAATGRRVEMPGMEFVKVRDGKIVVDNLYYDNLGVAAQFGLLPQSSTADAR
jgi:predicted ester cyclase